MAGRTKTTAPDTVTVPRSVLRMFVGLVDGLQEADGNYKPCQHSLFRSWAQSAYRAPNMRTAVAQAREALGEEQP